MPPPLRVPPDRDSTTALSRLFQHGLQLFRQGRLGAAKAACEELLNADPKHPDALHLLGLIAGQSSDYILAVELMSRAIALDPDNAALHSNRGAALQRLNRLDAALESCEKAVSLQPRNAEFHYNHAIVLGKLGQTKAAVASYDIAISIRADHAAAYYNRGIALKGLGDIESAIASYDRAISIQPDYAEAYNNRGNALHGLKRFDAALASCDRALDIRPSYPEAHNNRGNALQELQRFDAALASYDQAIGIRPDYAEAFYNRGKALRELQRTDAALASYDQAIRIKPDYFDAHLNRGNILRELKELDAALASYRKAIAIRPDDAMAHFSAGLCHLLTGDFENGWPKYEWRSKTDKARHLGPVKLSPPATRAELAGKRIALLAEQGIGDQIMFAALVPDALADAGKVALECDARLAGLFRRSFPAAAVFAVENPPARDVLGYGEETLLIGSLARLYRSTAAAFPTNRSYLISDAALARRWRNELARLGNGLKIGIVWRGGTVDTGAELRSIPLERLAPLLDRDGVHWVSLQHGNVCQEIARHKASGGQPILEFDGIQRDFDELAALIDALDLVISVQTSVVHLCGAMGKPCWALIPFVPEWRYGLAGERMRWYDSVALFRQVTRGDWDQVITRVRATLQAMIASR